MIEGINLYYQIVKVYGAEVSRMKYYMAAGWGLPVLIVITCAGVRFNTYASPNR